MTEKESWHNIGQRVRQVRKENQLTLKQLAKGCDLSPNSISLVERGLVAPTVSTLCKIAHALGVPASLFFQEICPGVDEPEASATCCTLSGDQLEDAIHAAPTQTLVCLSGRLTCQVNESLHHLNPGDTLTIPSQANCRWKNRGATPGVALLVLAPPEN